jgi:T5SS/PEP-CTERM-associated repeat protein
MMSRVDATRGRFHLLVFRGCRCASKTLLLISLLSASSLAVTRSWDGQGGVADTRWTTDVNWLFNIEPGASDTAEFDRGAAFTYDVTFPVLLPPGDITTDRLIVGSNTVTFEPDHSNTDYIAGTSDTSETGRGIIIGEEANDTAAVLTSHLGMLSTAAATLGHVAGSSGTLTLDQNNDQFNVTGSSYDLELIIGRYGTGVLNVSGGADVNVSGVPGYAVLGEYAGSSGTVSINGMGSTWSSGDLRVGRAGNGTLEILAGGAVDNFNAYIGSANGSGAVTVDGSGSTWTQRNSLFCRFWRRRHVSHHQWRQGDPFRISKR